MHGNEPLWLGSAARATAVNLAPIGGWVPALTQVDKLEALVIIHGVLQ